MGELSGVRLLLRGFGGVGGGGGLLLLFEDLGFGFGIRFGLVGVVKCISPPLSLRARAAAAATRRRLLLEASVSSAVPAFFFFLFPGDLLYGFGLGGENHSDILNWTHFAPGSGFTGSTCWCLNGDFTKYFFIGVCVSLSFLR